MHVTPSAGGPERKTASMPPQPHEGAKAYSSINTTDINILNPHIKWVFISSTYVCMYIKIYSMHQTQKCCCVM